MIAFVERAAEVGLDDRSEVLDREVLEGGVAELPGIVDHDVDGAEPVDGPAGRERKRL